MTGSARLQCYPARNRTFIVFALSLAIVSVPGLRLRLVDEVLGAGDMAASKVSIELVLPKRVQWMRRRWVKSVP